MRKQYIKNPIPAEISEGGGASILFVNKQTVPLDGWWVKEFNVKLAPDATDEFVLAPLECADDYSWITCSQPPDTDTPAAGTYPNATLCVDLERNGESYRLEIPINLVVG